MGGVPKRRPEAVKRELRIVGENLPLCCATCGELQQELHTEAGAANTRLALENLRIGDDLNRSVWHRPLFRRRHALLQLL